MIDIKTIGVWGFEGSLRGCRMPYESFDKSDSGKCPENCACCVYGSEEFYDSEDESLKGESWYSCIEDNLSLPYSIGEKDMELMKKLIKSGSEHRKFLRMIHVQAEIRAPRYWLTELDTYKVGTVRNSSSTMHLITKRELNREDFSFEKSMGKETIDYLLEAINCRIEAYNKKGSDGLYIYSQEEREQYFREIKQLLPESFMQRIIWDANYEVLMAIYHQRKNHRLPEWSGENGFCSWVKGLPYMKEFLE